MAKLCINISFMFNEIPFLERYEAVRALGFKAVESGFPFNIPVEKLVEAKNKSGLQHVLVNTFTGDVTKREVGFAAVPGKEKDFEKSIETTVQVAHALNAPKVHIMSGIVESPTAKNKETYISNLKLAAARLQKEGLLGLIEPINNHSTPGYYMNSIDLAVEVVKAVNNPNLKIMLDIFHLQHVHGDLTHTIKQVLPFVGHVQIAQVPNRDEPNRPGEINYQYILPLLREVGYSDWIGLEYRPANGSAAGLTWLDEFGLKV